MDTEKTAYQAANEIIADFINIFFTLEFLSLAFLGWVRGGN